MFSWEQIIYNLINMNKKNMSFFNFVDNLLKVFTRQQLGEKIQSFHVNDLRMKYPKVYNYVS